MHGLQNGSMVEESDPGEPSTGQPRISITPVEGKLLHFLARDRNVLEIGTGLGVSTTWLAGSATSVLTIDIDPWVQNNVWPKLNLPCTQFRKSRLHLVPGYDMVFIDGAHDTNSVEDDLAFAAMMCPRGVIVAHDWRIPEVRKALEMFGNWDYVPTAHGVAVKYVGWECAP